MRSVGMTGLSTPRSAGATDHFHTEFGIILNTRSVDQLDIFVAETTKGYSECRLDAAGHGTRGEAGSFFVSGEHASSHP